MNRYTLGQLAEILECPVEGDSQKEIVALAPLDEASENAISFLSSEKYKSELESTRAGAVILKPAHRENFIGNALVVDDPYLAFAKISGLFHPRKKRSDGVHPSAIVAEDAQVPPSVSIGPNCVIGSGVVLGENTQLYAGVIVENNTHIGANCILFANVVIYANVSMGDNVTIHSGAVIGADGFGFAPKPTGWEKIYQLGGVKIGNNVEIGSLTSIDCGAIEDTIIEDNVIIDNHVHIGHNCFVGERSAIAGCSGIAGSTHIGRGCLIGGAVFMNGHIKIADGSTIAGGSVVAQGTDKAGVYASIPPMFEQSEWRKHFVHVKKVGNYAGRIKTLEKTVNELKETKEN